MSTINAHAAVECDEIRNGSSVIRAMLPRACVSPRELKVRVAARGRAGITEKRGTRTRGRQRQAYSREIGVASCRVAFSPALLQPVKHRSYLPDTHNPQRD